MNKVAAEMMLFKTGQKISVKN